MKTATIAVLVLISVVSTSSATAGATVDAPVLVLGQTPRPLKEGLIAQAKGQAWDPAGLPVTLSASLGDFSGSSILDTGTFADAESLLSNLANKDVALGDLDGDADVDAFVVGSTAQVWRNDGPGQWTEVIIPSGTTSTIWGVALADLDGDDDLDALLATSTGCLVLRNDGALAFTTTATIGNPFGTEDIRSVALGDVDGDLDVDVVLAVWEESNQVWANDGAGVFSIWSWLVGSEKTEDVALGDFDGDGDLDVVQADAGLILNRWWKNDGTGTFPLGDSSLLPGFIGDSRAVATGDMNGDSLVDIVVVNDFGLPDELFLSDGTTFTQSSFGVSRGQDVALGDLDDDGDLDVWVADTFDDRLWLNDGTGALVESGQALGPAANLGVALADLDLDDDPDVFLASAGDDSAWLNGNQLNWEWIYEIADGPDDTQLVTVTATNGEIESTVEFDLVALNEAPLLVLPLAQVVAPNVLADISLGSLIDHGDDAPWVAILNWGDGSPVEQVQLAMSGPIGPLPHAWAYPQTATVSLTVTEPDGATDSTTFVVDVLGPRLTVADTLTDVNLVRPIRLGSFVDAGHPGPWLVRVNWGDGSPDDSFVVDQDGDLGVFEHVFDRLGDHVVVVSVARTSGDATGQAGFVVGVVDVAAPFNPEASSIASVEWFEVSSITGRIVYRVVLAADSTRHIYSIPEDGGTPLQLDDPAYPINYNHINATGTYVLWKDALGLRSSPVIGGDPTLIDGASSSSGFVMTPNGTHVLYSTFEPPVIDWPVHHLRNAAVDGSAVETDDTNIGNTPREWLTYESVSPSGQWYAYSRYTDSGPPALSLRFARVGGSGFSGVGSPGGTTVWWAGGHTAVFGSPGNIQSIQLSVGGSVSTALSGYNTPRAITPVPVDGDYQIVFSSYSSSAQSYQLFSGPVGGGTRMALANLAGPNIGKVEITPDGLTVVYAYGSSIYRVGTLGGDAAVLVGTFGGAMTSLAFSPDGQYVVYGFDDGAEQLAAVPIGGGAPYLLHDPLPPGAGVTGPIEFHPDSQSVTFIVDDRQTGMFELLDSPLAGGAPRRLNGPLQPEGDVVQFEWSADGRFLIYRADRSFDDAFQLFRVDDRCDVTDVDSDGDGIGDRCDLCPGVADPGQVNKDGDGSGDACDNCPTRFNDSQADDDNDGRGNACDPCIADADDPVEAFADTLVATDANRFAWTSPADVKVVRGVLADVLDFAPLDYVLLAASGAIAAEGVPAEGTGWYYLVAPRDCGSWQSTLGDSPNRDLNLP